ncbi:myelin protein zero-like protein 3 [Ictalurus punctatus]|uniref:Myelin protein zero-like protein 3 n=1 Tax=Ictalurus punctatus TaxID=7998 RepID=A0A2D0SX65_ICTPU|nr:myelin protein zero-like protein 3 [Ictalurus punctatus]
MRRCSLTQTWTSRNFNPKLPSVDIFNTFTLNCSTKMDLIRRQRTSSGSGMYLVLFLSLVLQSGPASCIKVTAPEEINAVQGEMVTLSCQFTSTHRPSSRISIDWSFRPQSGGPSQVFFHFYLLAYPPKEGHFNGRVQWHGDPARGDATIRLLNASLHDNGTYSCVVRNPPDFQGPPSNTILTVSLKKASVHFSDIAVLLFFVLLPSSLIALVLLARMLCPCCSPRFKTSHLGHHSPIEVTDGEEMLPYSKECGYHHPSPNQKPPMCCKMYMEDSDEECRRYFEKQQSNTVQPQAESQC